MQLSFDLIMNIFTGIVIETIIKKRAIAEMLLCVTFYYFSEVKLDALLDWTPFSGLEVAEFLNIFGYLST